MSGKESKKQKFIRAPSDLVSKLNEAAHYEGKNFYNYVTQVFQQAIRAYKMNQSLEEIIDNYEILGVNKEAGTTFIPKDILDYLIEKIYTEEGESLQSLWYQTGRWYGTFLNGRFKDSLEALLRLLKTGQWDLNEVIMNHNEEIIEFKCVSAFLSQERTILIQSFIKGAMHSLGYRTKSERCFKGIIHLKFCS